MTQPGAAFFTVDHGTATTAAALFGRPGGRWRLLAAGAVPAGIGEDVLLADLAARARSVDASVLPEDAGWEDWTRLGSRTAPPPPIVIAAASERSLAALEPAFADAGWRISAHATPDRLDAIAVTEALLAPDLRAVALGAASADRGALSDLAALAAAAVARRTDVRVFLCGDAAVAATWFPPGLVTQLPGPGDPAVGEDGTLLEMAERLAGEPWSRPGAQPEGAARGHAEYRRALASLAAVLDLRLDGIDIGASAGARALVGPAGIERFMVRAEAALVPAPGPDGRDEEQLIDEVVSWSPVRDDGQTLRDRVRNLRLSPWRDAAGDGARLRLAAARAALVWLDSAWSAGPPEVGFRGAGSRGARAAGPLGAERPASSVAGAGAAPDMLIASGGAFAVAPPPAVALALIDAVRRPGAVALVLDHARALAPLGSLEDEADRRRLLADLADDLLLPLGGAILAGGLRPGRRAHLRVESEGAASETALMPGTVQVVDLPPGLLASVEIAAPDDLWVGVRAKRVRFEMAGGLGGLLVDTRGIPLRLPQHPERRREALDAWQRPLWTAVDA
jgi:hypothetical protein